MEFWGYPQAKFLIASETLAMVLTACALSVFASQIHTPLFVAARHLPPERGKSALKGTASVVAGNFAAALKGVPLGELSRSD